MLELHACLLVLGKGAVDTVEQVLVPKRLLHEIERTLLHRVHGRLAALAEWDAGSLEAAIREVAEASGAKLGKLAQPLRAALTGRTTSPGIFDVLALLGREESLDRIADQMEPKE